MVALASRGSSFNWLVPIRAAADTRGAARLVFAVAMTAACGCVQSGVTGPASKPVVEFPSATALATVAATPAVIPSSPDGEVPADGWQTALTDTASGPDEAWSPQGPWEKAMADDVASTRAQLRLTRAMSCVAHELGRYYLASGAPAPETLHQFMLAACGAVIPQAGTSWIAGEISAKVTDEQILQQHRAGLKDDLLRHVPDTATEAGFWFGRSDKKVVAILAFGKPTARFTNLSLVPDAAGDAVIEGELDRPADAIFGWANQGTYGVEACAMDPSVARPRFRAVCHMATDDATAWVQLLYNPPRRYLSTPFVQLLLRRPERPLTFPPSPATGERTVASAAQLPGAMLDELNKVRARAGLRPVTLSNAESATAGRLVNQYFTASRTNGQEETVDRIALGLMAGWNTNGMIRDGQFLSRMTSRSHDVGRWLEIALASPFSRATLLSIDIDEIAVGATFVSESGGLAALVTGYRYYHGNDHGDDVRRIYARLVNARKRLGLKPLLRLAGMREVMDGQLSLVQGGRVHASTALRTSLQEGTARFGAGMRGYVIETLSLDALEIPEEVLRRPDLYVEVAVTHYKPPGAAWAQLVILVLFADQPGGAGGQLI